MGVKGRSQETGVRRRSSERIQNSESEKPEFGTQNTEFRRLILG